MFCDQCGKEMPDDSVYCPNCGAKNVVSTPVQEGYVEPQPVVYEEIKKPIPVVPMKPIAPAQSVQQPMGQPVQAKVVSADLTKPLGVLGFMGTLFVLSIPLIGLVMMFVWAFGSNVNKNRKNLSIAYIIYFVIAIVLGVVFGATVFVYVTEMLEQYSAY